MARLSRQTKEIIKTAAVVLLIALLVFFYWIYPLNRAKAMWGRTDLGAYHQDSVLARVNDPSAFSAVNLLVDTFRVDADGSTILAGVYLHSSAQTTVRGTVILLHSEQYDRQSLSGLAGQLVDSGFAVAIYDQRASGLSTGKYHSDGHMEGSDLEAVIAHLGLHNQLTAPVIVAGWKVGGDAALLAQTEDKRISAVLAVEPYLSSTRFIDAYQAELGTWRFPFFRTLMWFWLNARSSYGLAYNGSDGIPSVSGRAVIMIPDQQRQSPEITALSAKSGANLTVAPFETDQNQLAGLIVTLAMKSSHTS